MKNKVPVIIAVVGILATMLLISNVIKGSSKINTGNIATEEAADKAMEKCLKNVNVKTASKIQSTVDYSDNAAENLPNIETKYPITIKGDGDVDIEIFSTSEKAGKGNNGWLNDIAKEFNEKRITLKNGKTISVSIRSIASGAASDYISNNVYIPQAYTPSNELFIKLAEEQGAELQLAASQLVQNTAGIAIDKSKKSAIDSKYGETTLDTIVDSVVNGDLQLGYTYPYTSATGLNFLVNALQHFDSSDMLSASAIEKFRQLQKGIPFVCYTTDQMVNAMQNGTLQAGVVEYQAYTNNSVLKGSYEFIPFGYVHSNPLYKVGQLTDDESEAVERFVEYALSSDSQNLAEKYGFNRYEDFTYNKSAVDGNELINAQQLWKKEKNSGTPTIALFIADVSGSMTGNPIVRLKESLFEASKKINSENYVGLISYSDDITVNLPIAEFDLEQRSFFAGAVENLKPGGNTATYDALLYGVKMLNEMKEQIPDAKTMLFLLSDGQCNRGTELKNAADLVKFYGIPIYTIGYNEEIDSLKELSSINEAVYIDADSDDVVYELAALFNAQM